MTEALIKVEDVSKKFCRSLKRSLWYGLCDLGHEITGRAPAAANDLRHSEFWAVRQLNFEVNRGDCVGLIGANGAGKTTILRMLTGLLKPDTGRITIRGRVGGLIALGAGFNPILTGRENIYVNASVLGFSRAETDARLDAILQYCELGAFIDSPVQTYSSGMAVKLGFAIAIHAQLDVLLLDEVLAVGDASFRSKCYRSISDRQHETATIFISHNTEQLARICNRAIVLHQGRALYFHNTDDALRMYESTMASEDLERPQFMQTMPPVSDAKITPSEQALLPGEDVAFKIEFNSDGYLTRLRARAVIRNRFDGFSADAETLPEISAIAGKNELQLKLSSLRLRPGKYRVDFNLFSEWGAPLIWSHAQATIHIRGESHFGNADYQPTVRWESHSAV